MFRLDVRLNAESELADFSALRSSEALELCDRRFPPVKSPLGPITVRVGAETLVRSSSSCRWLAPKRGPLDGLSTETSLKGGTTGGTGSSSSNTL